jgi:hypothetical protein
VIVEGEAFSFSEEGDMPRGPLASIEKAKEYRVDEWMAGSSEVMT